METNRKNRIGFTLIELILVLGLVTTLGALAAPQFTDVFDHSKDQADIAQMDQILAAFQLEQAPFYEGHDGDYDLLKAENVKYVRENGKIVDTIVDPLKAEETLQKFLDNVVEPDSEVFMDGAKCVKKEKSHVSKNGNLISVFEAKLNNDKTGLKIVCRADKNESSIELRLPGLNKPMDTEYSDGEMVNGTWMIIGDDDRLRADYVEDYLKKKDQVIKEKLEKELKKNEPYKYRTTFRIETDLVKESVSSELASNIEFKEKWLVWAPKDANGTAHDAIKKGDKAVIDGVFIDYIYDGAGNGNNDHSGSLGVEGVKILLAQGNGENSIIFTFKKKGEKTLKRVYAIEVINSKNGDSNSDEYIVNGSPNNADEGYIKTQDEGGNPHYFHYKYSPSLSGYIDEDLSGATGIEKEIEYPTMDFYTGFVLNAEKKEKESEEVDVEYKNYDFLAFHYNEITNKTELSYKEIMGSAISTIGESVGLDDFKYNHSYTMEVDVQKDKTVYVTLYDHSTKLLDKEPMKMRNNTLRPAIGYYMYQSKKLNNKEAVTDNAGEIPLVRYSSAEGEGPRFVLLGLPEFYPYSQDSNLGSNTPGEGGGEVIAPEPEEPNEFEYKKPKIGDYSDNPEAPYKASATTADNSVQYNWVEGITNTDKPAAEVGWSNTYSVASGTSGWLWARESKDDKVAMDKWEKKPWIGSGMFNNSNFSGSGTSNGYEVYYDNSFLNMEILYLGGLNQEWSSRRPKLLDRNDTIQAYVTYNDNRVSETISYRKLIISVECVSKTRIRLKSNWNCKVDYWLLKNNESYAKARKYSIDLKEGVPLEISDMGSSIKSIRISVLDKEMIGEYASESGLHELVEP